MGYDVNRFVSANQINEDLVCNICKGVLEDGVWSPNCEHAFCKVCIHQWILRRNSCPNDRQPLNLAHLKPIPRFMRNLLDKLEIKCDFSANGCEQVFNLESLREHISICDFNPDKRVDCHLGCGVVIKKADLQTHNCVKSLRRVVDLMAEESHRSDRLVHRMRQEMKNLNNDHNRMKELVSSLQSDVKRLVEDKHHSGIGQISQSTSSSVSTLSSNSKLSRVVPNPYVLITPLQSSSPVVSDEPSSSTFITSGSSRLANEEPAFKRRTTTIRVASPLHSIRPIASTQTISPTVSLSFAVPSYSSAETIVSRSPSPRFMSSGTSVSPTIETIAQDNDSNTEISVSDRFAHSYSYITLDPDPDFDGNETEADDENTSVEPISEFDVEVQPSD